jgi:hypothetical protein
MSKYIRQYNQKVLWNVSKKIPNIQYIFPQTGQHETWFKNIIQSFYEKNKHSMLTNRDLENLNKETIQYMIHSLKNASFSAQTPKLLSSARNPATNDEDNSSQNKRVSFDDFIGTVADTKPSNNGFLPITPRPNTILKREPEKEWGNGKNSADLLVTRRQEYDDMLKRDVPPEPNFRELVEEHVIDNMEELVQQQLRQRELDVAILGSVPPAFIPAKMPNTGFAKQNQIPEVSEGSNNSGLRPSLLEPKTPSLTPFSSSRYGVGKGEPKNHKLLIHNDTELDNDIVMLENAIKSSTNESNAILKLLSEIKEELREIRSNISAKLAENFLSATAPIKSSNNFVLLPSLSEPKTTQTHPGVMHPYELVVGFQRNPDQENEEIDNL